MASMKGAPIMGRIQYSRTSPCGHPTTVDTPPLWTLFSRPVWFSLCNSVYRVSLVWTVDTSPIWTVTFCPKVGLYLSNVDTKIQNFYFGVHITKAQKNTIHMKCPQYQYGHFLVDSTCMSDALPLSLTSCEWAVVCNGQLKP